jgi:signal transduction histidine kinase
MWREVLYRLRGGKRLAGCEDEEAARQFHMEMSAFLAWTIAMAAVAIPLFAVRKPEAEKLMLVLAGVTLASLWFLRRGSKRFAASFFFLFMWFVITGLSFLMAEGRASGLYLSWAVVVILNVGWLLGSSYAVRLTVATLLVNLVRNVALYKGLHFPTYYPGAPMALLGGEIAVLLLALGPLLALLETQRQQVSALRDSEERFRSLSNGSFEGILVLDERGAIVDANLAFVKMFGYASPEDLYGRNSAELLVAVGVVAKGSGLAEFTGIRRDGQRFPVETESHPIRYKGKEAKLAAYRDLTERKQAEEERVRLQAELFQAQKMESIGRLAGGVAHDFNNLLTVINGYSQMALVTLEEDDPLHGPLTEIRKAGERSASLAKQLLAFGRKQVLLPQIVDLNQGLKEMRPMLARLLGEDVKLGLSLNAKHATVYADPTQLDQVILNLTVNARDAMPRGGKLLIETAEVSEEPGYVVLAASDTGTGMDEATRQRIFEPFFTTKEAGKGTGLGLSMVQGIVAQSGGRIEVRSKLGEGTSILIYLPRVDKAAPIEKEPSRLQALGGRETVLVVEDQTEVRNYVLDVLKTHGYRALQGESMEEILQICAGGQVQLVLTDVVMPNLSAQELAEQLATRHPEVKVLFMSGFSNDVVLNHGISGGEISFIQKPFSPERLAWKVRELLGSEAIRAAV